MSFGLINFLLITKATPADAQGEAGSGEAMMVSLCPKMERTSFRRSLSRWVSWIARMAILCLFMVRATVDHFSMPFRERDGAVKPFMLSEAMLILARLLFLSVALWPCVWVSLVWVGTGACWGGLCSSFRHSWPAGRAGGFRRALIRGGGLS